MKKIIGLFLILIAILIVNINVEAEESIFAEYERKLSSYGFDVEGNVVPLIAENGGFLTDSTVVYRKEKLEHTTSYVISHFQFDGTNIRGIVYRISTKPYQPGRNWGFMGIGSYGDDFLQDSVRVNMQLQTPNVLLNYEPKVNPTTGSIGVEVTLNGKNLGISLNKTINTSDLNIINNSDTVRQIYDVTYDFNQDVWNNYTTSEQYSYGIILYEYVSGRMDEYYMYINVKYHDWNGFEGGLENVNYSVKI